MMADIFNFTPRKSAASKLRVAAMTNGAIAYLDQAQMRADAARETEHSRKAVLAELEMAMRKAYAVLGVADTELAIPFVQSVAKLSK